MKNGGHILGINAGWCYQWLSLGNVKSHRYLTTPLVITSSFLNLWCCTRGFTTKCCIILDSFWEGRSGKGSLDEQKLFITVFSHTANCEGNKIQNVTSAFTVSQMRRWLCPSVVSPSHPQPPRYWWLCVCTNRIWVMLRHKQNQRHCTHQRRKSVHKFWWQHIIWQFKYVLCCTECTTTLQKRKTSVFTQSGDEKLSVISPSINFNLILKLKRWRLTSVTSLLGFNLRSVKTSTLKKRTKNSCFPTTAFATFPS